TLMVNIAGGDEDLAAQIQYPMIETRISLAPENEPDQDNPLTFLVPTRMGVGISCPSGYIVSEASHPMGTSKSGFPHDARSGRVPMAKHLVTSQLLGCNNYLCDFVSQNASVT
ncbi:MAG: hypothetical protein MUO62_19395, partial [Anaerolineales bacterium]|nr:hypothetical protein [Anaerolineales bacterium]